MSLRTIFTWLLVAGTALALISWALYAADRRQRTLVYTIPVGTAERLAAGESISVFPPEIRLSLARQDTLVIRNEDLEAVTIGPFRIAPGQQFRQQYWSPGTYELMCSIHLTEQVRIVVER